MITKTIRSRQVVPCLNVSEPDEATFWAVDESHSEVTGLCL